jgi:tetratricopeptide (TPR) repeat protein
MVGLLLAALACLAAPRARAEEILPLDFEPQPYDLVVLRNGQRLRGDLLSDPDAPSVRIRVRGSVRAFPRTAVARVEPRFSIEEAHDKLAASLKLDDHVKWHGLALACLGKKPPLLRRAASDLAKAVAANPVHVQSHVLRARVLLKQHRYVEARAAAERARVLGQESAEAHIVHGLVEARLGGDARPSFLKALSLGPSVEANLALARAELARGRYDAAEKAVAEAETLAPGTASVGAARGDFLLARGELSRAEVAYRGALSAPEVPNPSWPLAPSGREGARAGLASVLYLQGQLEEAGEVLIEADQTSGQVLYLQGLLKLARRGGPAAGSGAEARRLFLEATREAEPRAHLGLGTHLYLDLGRDLVAAAPEFRKATVAEPTDAYGAWLRGWCEYKLGRLEQASVLLGRAAELAPRSGEARAAVAAVAARSGNHAEAVRGYAAALDDLPNDPRLLAGLGLSQLLAGDPAAARDSLERAHGAGFRGPDVYLGLGYLAHGRGDADSAKRHFTAGLISAEDYPGARAWAREALDAIHSSREEVLTAFLFETVGEVPAPFRAKGLFGVKAASEGGSLVLSGAQEKKDNAQTFVLAPSSSAVFRSIAADFEVSPASTVTAGLKIVSKSGGVELAYVPARGLASRFKDGAASDWGPWQALMRWPTDGRLRLELSILESSKESARAELRAWPPLPGPEDEPAVRAVEFREVLVKGQGLAAGFFTEARLNEPVRVEIDNVFLVNRKAGPAPPKQAERRRPRASRRRAAPPEDEYVPLLEVREPRKGKERAKGRAQKDPAASEEEPAEGSE